MTAPYETVSLDRLRVGVQRVLVDEGLATLASTLLVRQVEEQLAHGVAYSFVAEVLAERLPPETITRTVRGEVRVRVPASPWQHVKRDHGRRWWLRWLVERWPVEYRVIEAPYAHEVRVDVRANWTYPRAAIALPTDRFGAPVLVALVDESDAVRELWAKDAGYADVEAGLP